VIPLLNDLQQRVLKQVLTMRPRSFHAVMYSTSTVCDHGWNGSKVVRHGMSSGAPFHLLLTKYLLVGELYLRVVKDNEMHQVKIRVLHLLNRELFLSKASATHNRNVKEAVYLDG